MKNDVTGSSHNYNDNSKDLVQNSCMVVFLFNNIPTYKVAAADFFSHSNKKKIHNILTCTCKRLSSFEMQSNV